MSIFDVRGTETQRAWMREAEERTDFPWDVLLPGLDRENKTRIPVSFADLTRYAPAADGEHGHVHDGDAVAHPIERVGADGRRAVWGLYYLPPHTAIVIEQRLPKPDAIQVWGSEVAHAVDYCYMTPEMRWQLVNRMHRQQLPVGHPVHDGAVFHLDGHVCSWFDGTDPSGRPIPYRRWCGEAMMEWWVEAFMRDVVVTINLDHPAGPEMRERVRAILLPTPPAPEPEPTPEPEPSVGRVYRGKPKSKVVHDAHKGIEPTEWFDSLADAQAAGLRACRVCKPT